MRNWLSVNIQYQHITIYRRYTLKQKIILVDFEKPGTDWMIPTSLLTDGIHPNNEGYQLMASAWFRGIQEAELAGFLSPPANSSFVNDDAGDAGIMCDKVYGVSRGSIRRPGQPDPLCKRVRLACLLWTRGSGRLCAH